VMANSIFMYNLAKSIWWGSHENDIRFSKYNYRYSISSYPRTVRAILVN
jgi:hypothetical protein